VRAYDLPALGEFQRRRRRCQRLAFLGWIVACAMIGFAIGYRISMP